MSLNTIIPKMCLPGEAHYWRQGEGLDQAPQPPGFKGENMQAMVLLPEPEKSPQGWRAS